MNLNVYSLPLWASFFVTLIGTFLSILLVRYAYKSVMFNFMLILTVGILVFAVHHILDLFLVPMVVISEAFEVLSSLIFLLAAIYLGLTLRKLL